MAVQANDRMEAVLPQIQKVGGLIEPLVIGAEGEVAVLAYDSRLREMQEFTSDTAKIGSAVKKIRPGSSQSRLIDAVDYGVRLLGTRPKDRRRILLIIGETRDQSSEGRLREAVIYAQLQNVSIYSVDVSRVVTDLTAKAPAAAARQPASGYDAASPGRSGHPQYGNASDRRRRQQRAIHPADGRAVPGRKVRLRQEPVELFTKGTGGQQFSFMRQRGLEDAIHKSAASCTANT